VLAGLCPGITGSCIRSRASCLVLIIQISCGRRGNKRITGNRNSTTSYKRYGLKAVAIFKSASPNSGNAASYGYAGKPGTISKSASINSGNAIGYGYVDKEVAASKSGVSNGGNFACGGKGYGGKAGATLKSARPNVVNAVSYG
jgi:hypothetical protein